MDVVRAERPIFATLATFNAAAHRPGKFGLLGTRGMPMT